MNPTRPNDPTTSTAVHRLKDGSLAREDAAVIIEEPLEIIVDGISYATTMRTPGDDLALAAGFCLAEGLIDRAEDLGSIQSCELEDANQVTVIRAGDRTPPEAHRRAPIASSCGLCGRDMITDLLESLPRIESDARVSTADLLALGRRLQEAQTLFRPTGGTHAAALFDAELEMLSVAEDVGRHNALDKAIGRLLLDRRLSDSRVAVLSGRCSFEMVQKVARAGIPIVASVSAPTALAVDVAQRIGITLVGFLRRETMTIYAGEGRIADLQ
jgi:FdhD protein